MSLCLHLHLPLRCIPGSESLNTTISQETLPSCQTELLSLFARARVSPTSRSLYELGPLPGTPSLDPRTHTWVLSDEWILPPGSIRCSTQVSQEGALHVSPWPLFPSLQLWCSRSTMSFYPVYYCFPSTRPRAGSLQVYVVWTPQMSFHPHICVTLTSGVFSTCL